MEGFEKKLESNLSLGVVIAATGEITGEIGRPAGLPSTWSLEKTAAGIELNYTRPGVILLVR